MPVKIWTIEDIRNPARKSGFNHVGSALGGNTSPTSDRTRWTEKWRAETGPGGSPTTWRGPVRPTPEEAAHDWCDHENAKAGFITIEDIRNPARKSGFDHVGAPWGGGNQKNNPIVRFQAASGPKSRGTTTWRGLRRATAEEAAQDYCDYINGQLGAKTSAALKQAGHPQRKVKGAKNPKMAEAMVLMREAKEEAAEKDLSGYVYLVIEEGCYDHAKIGESKDEPQYRLSGIQTGNPRKLAVLAYKKVPNRAQHEKELHAKFIKYNILGEWFTLTGSILKEFKVKLPKREKASA